MSHSCRWNDDFCTIAGLVITLIVIGAFFPSIFDCRG